MRKYITMTLALMMAGSALAQENVLKTRPANSPDGRILTMEETILSRDLSPERAWTSFEKDGSLIYYAEESFYRMNLSSGEVSVLKDYSMPEMPELPEEAQNINRHSNGNIAYTINGSLYYNDLNNISYLIHKSHNDRNVYGEVVSRHEFGISEGSFWSPDGKKLAYYKKDQSKVDVFPLLDITTRTGSLKSIRYPMAGTASEKTSLFIYDLISESRNSLYVDDFTNEQYLTNITWSPDGKHIYIQVLDRLQKNMNLNIYDVQTGKKVKTVLTEHNDRYVEPSSKLWFVSDGEFIYRTNNRDGYHSLYLCNNDGVIKRLTPVDADVQYAGYADGWVYYTSAEVSPVENHLFRVNIKKGKKERLTQAEGWHNIRLNEDCTWFTDSYSSLCHPGTTEICSTDGKVRRTLLEAKDPTLEYAYSQIDFGTVKSADGKYDNYYRLIKPKDFDPSKKYPVIVYVYGGPHSQMVRNTFMGELRRWEMYMAQRGYLVYVQDNRGTANRGLEFEQAIHRQCGQAEMADQMVGVNMLMNLPYVDKDRIGVHGWSYGGFMTISLITNYPEVFKVAVAGGPVIDWKWYEVMYGERYMETPQSNPDGYALTSLINKAGDLKGKLLICQGSMDNTVVQQHCMNFVQECIRKNVQVDYFPYPCAEHNMYGKERVHLMNKVSIYFDDYL